jgi:signal transduction histidine kinase
VLDTVAVLRPLARRRHVELVVDDTAPAHHCRVRPAAIRQAIAGVVLHAVQAAPPRSNVRISFSTSDHVVRVAVRGELPEGRAESPLLGLSQADRATGLEIPAARVIIEEHSGSLEVGRTEVALVLPAA